MNQLTPSYQEILSGLRSLRELLEDPKRWTKGASARNHAGDRLIHTVSGWSLVPPCFGGSPFANPKAPENTVPVCYCLLGGCGQITSDHRLGADVSDALSLTLQRKGVTGMVHTFNDDELTTHADVLDLIDQTIERVKEGACRHPSP